MADADIDTIVHGADFSQKVFLFDKILQNSSKLFNDLKIFSKDDLEQLLTAYQVPAFNRDYIFRRKNMVEVYFFDKPLLISELKWLD